jgi:hypothetical protein
MMFLEVKEEALPSTLKALENSYLSNFPLF